MSHNPAIGRFLSVDPLSHEYPSLSPYVFVANNPIKLTDPDGRDIIVTRIAGGGENEKDLVLITMNIRIIDKTTINNQISALKTKGASRKKGLNKKDSERLAGLETQRNYIQKNLAKEIETQLSAAFTGKGQSIDWKFDAQGSSVTFANSLSAVSNTDNVIYAVDGVYEGEIDDPQNYGKKIRSYGNSARAELGGIATYFSLGVGVNILAANRVYAHELGHNAGLLHPSVMYSMLTPKGMRSEEGAKRFEMQFYSSGGNLMLSGARKDGKLITEEHQILQIEKLFNAGKLNIGSNKYDPDHAKQGRGTKTKERKEYLYTPTN